MPAMSDSSSFPVRRLLGFRLRTWAMLIALIALGGGALALDLAFEGRVYQALWELTGETDPGGQIVGFGQYLARWTRVQPRTEPFAPVAHNVVNPFGVNTFLEQEVELSKREQQMRLIAEAGFGWIRQQFPWEDIEIDGKGDFTDRRHDRDGDGQPDAISAWEKYDTIVDLAERYGVRIIARLSAPPDWAQSPDVPGDFAPPADMQDFVDYAAAVAGRYQGRITHYQVWNEPNLYPEWGEQTVSAEAYTEMLCRTYAALKAVDPQIVVISGALGPTIDLSGRNAYDLLYLQRMYQAGAGDCFDVLSVQGYGLWSGPTDRRLRQTTINFPRVLWVRDMMIANGDADKPIWISEAGWNPVPDDPTIADGERYGRVTMDEAAAWAPLAYARAIEEWPWVGVISGALGPTIDLSGRNAYDLLYLQRMYQAGASGCFDVLSVQGYGLWSGPTDRRLRQTTINFPRVLWVRDMMIANGDADKPIWISEAGWNPVPDDPAITDGERYGRVTMDEAATWAPLAYARAIEEWPWIGVISYWYFKRADDSERGASWYYFRMVEPDFTLTPVYEALKAYITGTQPKTLGAGRHSTRIHAVFAATKLGEARTFRLQGTGAVLCHAALDAPRLVHVRVDGDPAQDHALPPHEAGCTPLAEGLGAGTHTLTITAADWTGLDNLIVLDFGARQRLPWLLVGVVALIGVGAVALRAYAIRWGL